jgi:hypothetical protein
MQKELKMNKMHTLTKIALSAIGIFFALRLLSSLPIAIFQLYSKPSWETAGALAFSISLVAVAIGLLVYFFIYRNDKLTKKIVGPEQLSEPDSQIEWLPVAFRLICIASGIYLLNTVIWETTYVISQLAAFTSHTYANYKVFYTYAPFSFGNILPWIITLAIGIYLVCGAPHFVRWQVKKTLQQCSSTKQ